jgi:N-acetylmuramoyl-L-alanine amidase
MATMWSVSGRVVAGVLVACALALTPAPAFAQGPREQYTKALARERELRDGERPPTARQIREVVAAYEGVVRRYPTSGYSDNALWQASNLSLLAYQRFGSAADRRAGLRLLSQLKASYPSSTLLERYDEVVGELEAEPPAKVAAIPDGVIMAADLPAPKTPVGPKAAASKAPSSPPSAPTPAKAASVEEPASKPAPGSAGPTGETVAIKGITRTTLPDGIRVSIEMNGEIAFHQERLDNPSRVFFDLKNARPVTPLLDATLKYPDELVEVIRLGRHPQNTTRVVMDMNGVDSYSVFNLYNPYRLVIDFHKTGAPAVLATAALSRLPVSVVVPAGPLKTTASVPDAKPASGLIIPSPVGPQPTVEKLPSAPPGRAAAAAADNAEKADRHDKLPLPSRPVVPPALAAPAVPSANSNGRFSIARQLGLGVSRIVIDAGHGGHDPGAHGNGINESELVLDVALRLRKLLDDQPGMEVVMTRDTDVFIPLEERTAIANRESADLFLSIHANASRNTKARGIETYFLNFASNPEAAAVAARENSGSGKAMHSLPEIVRAITLNNKIDESRDFAEMVQRAMVKKLAPKTDEIRDLGVKQAPFVVLIGAGMPSVLAEISFVTHKQEGQLLKTQGYRQQIAEALFDAVQVYQRSLKSRNAIATREQ